jgi:hypothetical protein
MRHHSQPEKVGQRNKLTYRWARKGSRPRVAHDQRTQSTYLFGAVCPERGAGAALVPPACNTEAMQLHLDEIATKTGTPARWASNHENPLALLECGARTVVVPHLAHGGGDGWNSSDMTRRLPDFQAGAQPVSLQDCKSGYCTG